MLGLSPREALIFYLLIPVVLGFLAGWPQAGRTAQWPKFHAVGFWVILSVGGWWLNDLFTRILQKPLRRARFPLWAVLLMGALFASLPADFFFQWVVHVTYRIFPGLPLDRPLPVLALNAASFLKTHGYAWIVWPTINLVLFHVMKMPRYGFSPVAKTQLLSEHGRDDSPFLAKWPAHLRGEILALEAEQHYLRIHSTEGNALILYRLSDAMRELGPKGMQVHRSFWVTAGAVAHVVRNNVSLKLVLTNGMEIPVSRSFRLSVQQADFLQSNPGKN
ncbi:hypothetical protein FHS49_002406 [Sphingobium boeckii]|uniref:HTH LytTR-type domain-containing protein n=1 Tax=Sphingobium boeckii TaxID=1082345 RepID=A0A7W9AJ25_9SPHN|nr:hypothetical protein [Sphingobium boeckii]